MYVCVINIRAEMELVKTSVLRRNILLITDSDIVHYLQDLY